MSSYGLKPAKVVSYLSDDSMSGEFPKRAYSVGSRPNTKPLRHHPIQDIQKKQVLDNSRSSSAPHLIVQKSRSPYLDSAKYQNPYDAYQGTFDTDRFKAVLLMWISFVIYVSYLSRFLVCSMQPCPSSTIYFKRQLVLYTTGPVFLLNITGMFPG